MTPCSYKFKLIVFLGFMLVYWIFYLYPNLIATWEPHLLPLWGIDQNTPFLPITFLVYMSDYFVFVLIVFLLDTRERFLHLTRMCFLTLVICGTFFILYPTTYPRPIYPASDNIMVQFAMNLISTVDSPRNCFPSMHVALTGVATYSIRHLSMRVRWAFLVWTLCIYASTLTTKQHYFVDVLGGVAVVLFVALSEHFVLSNLRWSFST